MFGGQARGAHESATWRRQARRQAGRQAGMQAGRQAALMGRKSKAGRNVNPRQAGGTRVSHLAQAGTQAGRQAGVQAGRQAGSFDGKEKQGRPQRKPSILA